MKLLPRSAMKLLESVSMGGRREWMIGNEVSEYIDIRIRQWSREKGENCKEVRSLKHQKDQILAMLVSGNESAGGSIYYVMLLFGK